MAVNGISGSAITGTLGDANAVSEATAMQEDAKKFSSLVKEMQKKTALSLAEGKNPSETGISSGQISRNHRLNGDYTQGFYGAFTSESDKTARPRGFAGSSRTKDGKTPVIDKTSDLYAQSLELENYMVKTMLSSMRQTIQHESLAGKDNEYARKMYDDMMYDNVAESITKNASFGLADEIYIELSGQR
jgi:flagellar protein FlgJ